MNSRSRVTLDLDAKPGYELTAIRAYHSLFRYGAVSVDVSVSSGGKGLHLVGWFDDDLGVVDRLHLREQLGDDPNRIRQDIDRARIGHPVGTLWSSKSKKGEKERDFADVYDALDFIRGKRDDHDRMNRLANEGHKGAPDLARLAP